MTTSPECIPEPVLKSHGAVTISAAHFTARRGGVTAGFGAFIEVGKKEARIPSP